MIPLVTLPEGSHACSHLRNHGDGKADCALGGECESFVERKPLQGCKRGFVRVARRGERKTAMVAPATLTLPSVRNLLYHIYPVRGGIWRWNVAMLKQRLSLFNGKRIVSIAHGPETEPPEAVRHELQGEAEFVEQPNDPSLREVLSFVPLWSRVQSTAANEATFFGHSKGVARAYGTTSCAWAAIMYEACLDYWPLVEGLLKSHPLAGPFLKVGRGWPAHESLSQWHYSGSFYWFRSRDVFLRPDWQRIDRCWTGIEPWPSLHFPVEDAACIFHQGRVGEVNLYDRNYFDRAILPAWETWKAEHRLQMTGVTDGPA